MLRREVMKLGGSLFGLGAGTPSRFPYPGRPQPSPGVSPSQGNVVRARQVIVFGPGGGLYVYSGQPAAGNLVESAGVAPGTTLDPINQNAVLPGDTTYNYTIGHASVIALQKTGGTITAWTAATQAGPYTLVSQVIFDTGGNVTVGTGNLRAAQTAEFDGAVSAQGATSGAGQLFLIKQAGTAGDHALTVLLSTGGAGGAAQAAANIVSDNNNFSALEVTGAELGRGTVKIAHQGQASGADANAAGLSIDLQTDTGGATGTQAQGIFITSTTDAIPGGNALTVRYNAQDWFVVKGSVGAGNGIVGIGIATGHVPAGMLEITQKDTTTPGLYMTALAAGADLVQLKDSGGALRFQVNNAGNAVHRANALFTTNVIVGSASAAGTGGAGSAIQLVHTTDPGSNPPAGSILLYCDATGHLIARGSSGTLTTIAGP